MQGRYDRGSAGLDELLAAYRDVAVAARDSGLRGERRRRELVAYRDAMVKMRQLAQIQLDKFGTTSANAAGAEGHLAEAEYWLAEVDAEDPPRPGSSR